jgi:hypothetical protein
MPYSFQYRPSTNIQEREYPFTCCICGEPGIGTVPLQKTHLSCMAERKRRAWRKFKGRQVKEKL